MLPLKNAIDVLSLSIKVHSEYLKKQALQTIAMNLGHFYKDDTSKNRIQEQLSNTSHQDLYTALFEEIKDLNGTELIIPQYRRDQARKMIQVVQKRKVRQQQLVTAHLLGQRGDAKLSAAWVLRGVVAIVVYSIIMLQTSLRPIVPFVNVGILLIMARYIYTSIQ